MALEDLRRREAERRRHASNKGRLAGVYADVTSTGQGLVEYDEAIDFGLTYVEAPWVSMGHELNLDDLRIVLGLELDDDLPEIPHCTGYVSDWETDEKGNYVGAYVAVQISWGDGIPADAEVSIRHMFSFQGIAIKNVPNEILGEE